MKTRQSTIVRILYVKTNPSESCHIYVVVLYGIFFDKYAYSIIRYHSSKNTVHCLLQNQKPFVFVLIYAYFSFIHAHVQR